jgi:LysM repeat protein
MAAAQAQATWSAANNHFGHDGPGGSSPDDRAKAAGYGDGEVSFAIENVASGTISLNTPELVVTMWQGDWGHLNAMISADYEHIGVGYAEGEEFNWYVMMVGWVGEKGSAFEPDSVTPEGDLAMVPFVVSTPGEDGAIFHEVKPGQAAWTIAVKYGIPLADLLALNGLAENSWLHPGDVLVIRPPDAPTTTPTRPPATRTPRPTATATESGDPFPSVTAQFQTTATQTVVSRTPVSSSRTSILLVAGVGLLLLLGVVVLARSRQL